MHDVLIENVGETSPTLAHPIVIYMPGKLLLPFSLIYIYVLENGLEIFMYFYTVKYRNHLHFLSLPGPKGLSNTGIKPKSKK